MIEEHCVEHIIDEVEEKPTAKTAEVLKLKLEFEHEERRLACKEAREEAQRARDAEKASNKEARELRLAELKEARELCKLELKAEAAKEAVAREHELKWLVWVYIPLSINLVPLTLLEILD